jgi:hypothetical protein
MTTLHERFVDYRRGRGNGLAVGLRLPQLLESAGLTLEAFRGSCQTRSRTSGERGPSWAARRAMEPLPALVSFAGLGEVRAETIGMP